MFYHKSILLFKNIIISIHKRKQTYVENATKKNKMNKNMKEIVGKYETWLKSL